MTEFIKFILKLASMLSIRGVCIVILHGNVLQNLFLKLPTYILIYVYMSFPLVKLFHCIDIEQGLGCKRVFWQLRMCSPYSQYFTNPSYQLYL